MPKKSLAQAIAPQPEQTPLAKILASYNEGSGGPEGATLLSVLARLQDPRAEHWRQWEFQRRKDANNGGVLPEEIRGRPPEAYITNEPQMPISFANRVQGQPMAPGEYEAMMRDYNRKQLLSLGRGSQMGRDQALQNASNNLGLMWDKNRIDNKPMPAEYSYLGQRPGSIQNFIAKLVSADPLSPE